MEIGLIQQAGAEKRTHVVAIMLDSGGRFVAAMDIAVSFNRIATDQLPGDEALVKKLVPEHRPKLWKKRFFERRGPDMMTRQSGTVLRTFVEVPR